MAIIGRVPRPKVLNRLISGWLLPVVCGVLVLTATLIYWNALVDDERSKIEARTAVESDIVTSHIAADVRAHFQSIERMADRWEIAGRPTYLSWQLAALLILNDYPGFQSIQWMDAGFQVQWVVPANSGQAVLGLDHTAVPEREEALTLAQQSGELVASAPVDLALGGRGFVTYRAVSTTEEAASPGQSAAVTFDGFLIATFVASDLFEAVFQGPVSSGYSIAISSSEDEVYVHGTEDRDLEDEWGSESTVALAGRDWLVRTWPQAAELERQQSGLTTAALIGGIVLSILIATLVRFVQVSRQRTAETRAANAALKRSSDALEASNQELEQFAYVASHDLRAPLVSLRGMADILVEDFGDSLPSDAQMYLDRIGANASRMQHLLDDLLQVSRLRQTEVEFSTVNLNAIVQSVVDQMSQELEARQARVSILSEIPSVQGNALWLGQIFANLIDNGIKYAPLERQPLIEIGCHERNGALELFVRDNGPGIPEEHRDRVFEMFQRLPNGRAANPGGSGMGLAIVSRAVEAHGGKIWIESTSENGTTFAFTIALADTGRRSTRAKARAL